MKKQPFTNILLRFLRKAGIKYRTINSSILITSPILRDVLITPDRTRCTFSDLEMRLSGISIDCPVGYSIEALLYKLFKFGFINTDDYLKLSAVWQK